MSAEYRTMAELADLFDVSVSTVKKKVASRLWPCTHIGGSVRFTPEHVAAIAAAGEKPAVNAARTAEVVPIRSRIRRSA